MDQDSSVIVQMKHISKQVGIGVNAINILNDINLSIHKGETVAIQGASGSGKTTLLSLLAGLDIPTSGDIYFEHFLLSKLDEEQRTIIRGKYMSFIFQSFQLLDTLTALENVMLPLEIQYMKHDTAKSLAIDWLKEVGLGDRLYHYPTTLSGGEQQRVAIARSFVTNPKIIFADEMTGNLDIHTGKIIDDIVFSINQNLKTTLVLVTHDAILAERCQHRLMLHDGILLSC